MNSRIKSCYLTAPAGINLEILTNALHQRGIAVAPPHRSTLAGEFTSDLSTTLTDVDLVIGVISRARGSDWVLFELGQAWGMGKRILLFAPPKTSFLPSSLSRFLTVRANLTNREAIEFALDQLIAVPERSQAPSPSRSAKKALGPAADQFLLGSYPLDTGIAPKELENIVSKALHEAGVEAMATGPRSGVDMVIWSDALQPYVGNPLLIEVKANLRSDQMAATATKVLSQQVTASGAYWGLLLYGEADKNLDRFTPPSNVLVLWIKTLLERMREETFDDIVRDLRNQRVHGGSF